MKKEKSSSREYLVVTWFFLIIFMALILYFILFECVLSDQFVSSRKNTLQDLMAEYVVRGDLISSDGQLLATTDRDAEGNETRIYPYGRTFAHAVGFMVNGKLGLENQVNFKLLRSNQFFAKRIVNNLSDEKNLGDDVYVTLRADLQQIAYDDLGNHRGAVLALDPKTGAVLAMVSKPDFDPNTIEWDWDTLVNSDSDAMYNRALLGQYAPGSTFKIFTLLEYYKEHKDSYNDYLYDCDSSFTLGEDTIHCAGNHAHGTQNLMQSFANSCNSSFSSMSLQLDPDKFRQTCEELMFNHSVPGIRLQSNRNYFTLDGQTDPALIMQTGIGQGETLVTPLYMAMICGAICNDGILMKPFMVDYIRNADGITISTTRPSVYRRILEKDEAGFLEEYMGAVVSEGTAKMLDTDSYEVYGKTGSAQTSDSLTDTNAWFVGYARKGQRQISVAIIVEGVGAGSTYAAPIAKDIFDTYLR